MRTLKGHTDEVVCMKLLGKRIAEKKKKETNRGRGEGEE